MALAGSRRQVQRQQRRQQQANASRQRRIVAWAAAAIGVVLAALVVARVVSLQTQPSQPDAPVPTAVMAVLTGIPASVFEQVGRGTATTLPTAVQAPVSTGPNGHPLVTYVGAEYCPFCAAERWPMVVALSRFGQFSYLETSHSASDDVFPNTPTFSFANATFSSPYIDFSPIELQSNVRSGQTYAPLQTPTPDQTQLLDRYDAPPYVPAQSEGAIPFLDIANQFVQSGASYDSGVLRGQTVESVADELSDPTSPRTQAIVGSANVLTAALCSVTGDSPANVCTQPAITALESTLASAPRT